MTISSHQKFSKKWLRVLSLMEDFYLIYSICICFQASGIEENAGEGIAEKTRASRKEKEGKKKYIFIPKPKNMKSIIL